MRASLLVSAFVLVAAASPVPAFADRAAIERTLKEMSDASLKADVDGYLAHVSRRDPIFYKEQQNWAKDLKRRTPTEVSFSIAKPADGEEEMFGEKSSRFELKMHWSMPPAKEGGNPFSRDLSFPVVFVRGGDGAWLYAGEDWQILEGDGKNVTLLGSVGGKKPASQSSGAAQRPETDGAAAKKEGDDAPAKPNEPEDAPRPRDARFQGPEAGPGSVKPSATASTDRKARVMYFPGYEEVARKIAEVLPAVREHVDEGFQIHVPRVQEVKIYPSMLHLQESIYLSYEDGLSGWNEPGESIKIITNPRRASKRGLTSLLAHEYGHVATFELGPKANDMPWWALEGVAELSAERFAALGHDAENAVMRWQRANALAKWDDLADFHKVQDSSPRDLQAKVYKQGQHMLMYISDRFGRDARNAWLTAMGQGKTIDEASRAAFKMGFDELDAAWRASVAEMTAKADAEKAKKEAEEKGGEGKG